MNCQLSSNIKQFLKFTKFYKYRRKFHKSWTWKVPPLGSFAAHRKSSTTSSLSNQLAWFNKIPWWHYHDDPDDEIFMMILMIKIIMILLIISRPSSLMSSIRGSRPPIVVDPVYCQVLQLEPFAIAIGSVFIIWHLATNLLDDELQLQFVGNAKEIRSWRFEKLQHSLWLVVG